MTSLLGSHSLLLPMLRFWAITTLIQGVSDGSASLTLHEQSLQESESLWQKEKKAKRAAPVPFHLW